MQIIIRFIGSTIDVFGTLMILYIILKQSNNDNILISILTMIFIFCIIFSHLLQYIIYEILKKEEPEQ